MKLIKKIKEKKELSGITNSLIKDYLNKYIKKHNISLKELNEKQEKIIVKDIRAQLRNLTGQFQKSSKNRESLLNKNKINELLKTHSSTAERLDYYPKLKALLKKLEIKSVLDLGCGLNPIALANKNITYYASDIKEDELEIIEEFFKKNNIKGITFTYNLEKAKSNLPITDITLLFKILDTIEKKHAEKILNSIKSKYILASFSTNKLSGRKMSHPRRLWFEKLLNRLNLKYKIIKSENEIFYLINRELKII